MYAIAFILAMFAVPPLAVSGWAYMLERVRLTDRGMALSFWGLLAGLLGFALLMAWILPTPMPGL